MASGKGIDWSSLYKKEDWWALWLGLLIFFIGLLYIAGVNTFGWFPKIGIWVDPAVSVTPASKDYAWLHPILSYVILYVVTVVLLSIAVVAMKWNLKRFIAGYTFIYIITMITYWFGHWAYIAETDPKKVEQLGFSLRMTGEAGLLFALLAGLIISNFFRGFANFLRDAAKPELYIKIAIVLLGAKLGIDVVRLPVGLLANYVLRGVAAIVEAYLIYWGLAYIIARKWGLTREWAAPLASGISICGVSAAIATAAVIRARPHVPAVIASLVVVFAAVELVILPFVAAIFLAHQPLVAGAWMGLAIKTDGAAAASGAIVDALMVGWYPEYAPLKGWILNTTVLTKLFIDIFIGVWAFILAVVWVYWIERRPGEKVRKLEIWFRFPKFVLGFMATMIILAAMTGAAIAAAGADVAAQREAVKPYREAQSLIDDFRKFFFAMTFTSIGLITDFGTLKREGFGKIIAIYLILLFGVIIWIGFAISWLFFHDVHHYLIKALAS
ncbi:putative membrane protein [Pyrobaculum oguniense TE7]|uniref:Membrane protein n=1 Tax=Pyrobaculum oguniense (strain DSM 13380 / JCM 10595 / TE7) TaxID=698757 RepID=H6Q9T2_PYROT|nr:putative membrane protein [Pyrobaculum oguniense TE7]